MAPSGSMPPKACRPPRRCTLAHVGELRRSRAVPCACPPVRVAYPDCGEQLGEIAPHRRNLVFRNYNPADRGALLAGFCVMSRTTSLRKSSYYVAARLDVRAEDCRVQAICFDVYPTACSITFREERNFVPVSPEPVKARTSCEPRWTRDRRRRRRGTKGRLRAAAFSRR